MNNELLCELKDLLGEQNVLTSPEERLCHSYDAQLEEALPDAVVLPGSAEECVGVVALAAQHKVPIIPRGAGSGLAGGTVPVRGGLIVVTSRLNRILDLNTDDLFAITQPGVTTIELEQEAESRGLLFAPDPSSHKVSTLGGNVATNAGGLRGLKYGVTGDYVMALQVALSTGELLRTGARTVKSVVGPNVTQLFVGSEGILGLITEITFRLIPKPEYARSLMAAFGTVGDAARTVADIIRAGVIPATLEFMDQVTLNAVEDFKPSGLPRGAKAVLLIETDGTREAALKEADQIIEVCHRNNPTDIHVARSEAERSALWNARRAALPSLSRVRPTTILEDATVPRSKVPAMVEAVEQIANRHRVQIGTFGHAGDGNLHPTLMTDAREAEEMRRVHAAIADIFDAALELGGTLSGEHGIGLAKSAFIENEVGDVGLRVLQRVREAFDPAGIMNPGKIFPPKFEIPRPAPNDTTARVPQ